MKPFIKEQFGQFENKSVDSYTFETNSGYQLKIMTYGATLLEYVVFDKNDKRHNITLRFSEFDHYIQNTLKLGATVGPVAGRIANGTFTLNGKDYELIQNNGTHHLHSGPTGYADSLFDVVSVTDYAILLYHKRLDKTGGYPGEVETWVTYSLNEKGELTITYRVTTTADTLVNPTNHTYFNLSGQDMDVIDDTIIKLNANSLSETDDQLIPTGTLLTTAPVLQQLKQGTKLFTIFESLGGLDDAFVLNNDDIACELYYEKTGIHLTVKTESPAMVIYTANSQAPNEHIINHKAPFIHNGIALETQQLPDAIHHEHFGNIVLTKGEEFQSQTTYYASVQ